MSSETAVKKNIQKLQRAIVDGLEDVKAQDIQVFNTETLSPLFERVIVASGTSNRQTKALAASVRDAVREAGFDKPRTEGEDNGEWIIVDCGAAVVHVMQPSIRQYYRLEEIWGEKPVRLKHAPQAKFAQSEAEQARKPARKTPAKSAVKSAAAPAATPKAKPAARTAAAAPAKVARKKPASASSSAGVARPARKSAAPVQVLKVGEEVRKPARKAASKTAAKSVSAPATKAPAAARKRAQPKA